MLTEPEEKALKAIRPVINLFMEVTEVKAVCITIVTSDDMILEQTIGDELAKTENQLDHDALEAVSNLRRSGMRKSFLVNAAAAEGKMFYVGVAGLPVNVCLVIAETIALGVDYYLGPRPVSHH